MNLRNFCILIFNKNITPKYFVFTYILGVLFVFSFSLILNLLNFNITGNDLIKNYQLEKINSTDFNNVNTIIVGDSSGGNSLNSKYFNELSGLNSENLCLTGSWGIVGSLGIIQNALKKNSNIRNIIVIQTLDIWPRGFPKESILDLFEIEQGIILLGIRSVLSYYFNPKEILWNLKFAMKSLFKIEPSRKIDITNDYILQNTNKFSNNKKQIEESKSYNKIKISSDKKMELDLLQSFCKENSLNCIFLNGPIHDTIIKNSPEFLDYINKEIKRKFSYIKYYPNVFSYINKKMGDSSVHIDIRYKNESTLNYYNLIKNDLLP